MTQDLGWAGRGGSKPAYYLHTHLPTHEDTWLHLWDTFTWTRTTPYSVHARILKYIFFEVYTVTSTNSEKINRMIFVKRCLWVSGKIQGSKTLYRKCERLFPTPFLDACSSSGKWFLPELLRINIVIFLFLVHCTPRASRICYTNMKYQ